MFRYITITLLTMLSSFIGIYISINYSNIFKTYTQSLIHGEKSNTLEYLTSSIIALPILKNSELVGFFIIRFAVGISFSENGAPEVGDETFIADLFYQVAFNSSIYIAGETDVPDASVVTAAMLERAKELTGSTRYARILIQQIDYFDRTEVRAKNVEERMFSQ